MIDRKLPADPDGQNDDRSSWAETAIKAFMSETGTDPEDAVSDLLDDLIHWCDRNSEVGFEAELERARGHYEEETYLLTTLEPKEED